MDGGFGVIRLGEVTAYGEWKKVDGQVWVSFESRSLGLKLQDELARYKALCSVVMVQLPKDYQAEKATLVGFRDSGKTMTFILKRMAPDWLRLTGE
jgi:hypothetical protein